MTVLAFTAYAVWITLAATLFRTAPPPGRGGAASGRGPSGQAPWPPGGVIASCLAAGAFFFVPPGSLPPFFNYAWSGGAFIGCLALSALAEKDHAGLIALLPPGCIAVVFFWYAQQRGMPGSATNLGTFVGMPVWGIAPFWQGCGFAALALGFLLAARMFFAASADFSLGAVLRGLALCALFVSLFAPWNTAPYLDLPDAVVAGCDFLLFWGKALCLVALLRRFSALQAGGRLLALACCIAGGVLVVFAPL